MNLYLKENWIILLPLLFVCILLGSFYYFVLKKHISKTLTINDFLTSYDNLLLEMCIYFLGQDSLESISNNEQSFNEKYDTLTILEFKLRIQFLLSKYENNKKVVKTEKYQTIIYLETLLKNHKTDDIMIFFQEFSKQIAYGRKKRH